MKKRVLAMGILLLSCLVTTQVYAGGIRGKSNMSADYFRSLTRNAATDSADIIAYNPSGVMKLENGFYQKVDILYIKKDYGNNIKNSPFPGTSKNYESDYPSIVPGLFSVYKQERWAGFFAVTVPGGGGTVKFDEGNATSLGLGAQVHAGLSPLGGAPLISNMKVEASGVEMGYTLGGAFLINKIFSVSGGIRYIDAKQELDARVTNSNGTTIATTTEVELERNASGIGYFIGANVSPTKELNLGFLYQSNTELDLKSEVSKGNTIAQGIGFGDGTKQRNDLPGLIGLGISYQLNPNIRLESSYTHYLESDAELEASRFDDAGDSSDLAFGITYILNSQWRFSLGYMITSIEGMDPEDISAESPELDANTIGFGTVYSPSERWQFSIGITDVTYDSVTETTAFGNVEYEKHVTSASLGVQYRF